jgi:hypothetical protein
MFTMLLQTIYRVYQNSTAKIQGMDSSYRETKIGYDKMSPEMSYTGCIKTQRQNFRNVFLI